MTDEQIIRARVLMAEQGIRADDLTDEQVMKLVKSLGGIFCEMGRGYLEMFNNLSRERWPRGDFEPILPAPVLDEPGLTPAPPPPA